MSRLRIIILWGIKMRKKPRKTVVFMSNLQTYYYFKLNFQKVDQQRGGKWLIHGTKCHFIDICWLCHEFCSYTVLLVAQGVAWCIRLYISYSLHSHSGGRMANDTWYTHIPQEINIMWSIHISSDKLRTLLFHISMGTLVLHDLIWNNIHCMI